MAGPEREPLRVVSLNEVLQLVSGGGADGLRELLRVVGAGPKAQCDGLCDCNIRYCACNGSVTNVAEYQWTYDDFMKLREQRIADLRAQLASLEPTVAPSKGAR